MTPLPASSSDTAPPTRPSRTTLAAVSHDLKDPLAAIEPALDFALDRTTVDPEPEPRAIVPVSAAELVDEVAELYAGVARVCGVTLVVTCDADLPALVVRADPVLRALGNLLGNAIKFTPHGGRVAVRATRATRASRAGAASTRPAVTIAVADTGPGIPPDALPHLFRRFWQAPATAHLGTGAGLLIARMLVEDEGGTVGVHSLEGSGAEFSVTLPATER